MQANRNNSSETLGLTDNAKLPCVSITFILAKYYATKDLNATLFHPRKGTVVGNVERFGTYHVTVPVSISLV